MDLAISTVVQQMADTQQWRNQGSYFVVSKTKTFKHFFCLFSKTFESNQLSKNCECKHHFCTVISPSNHILKCAFSSIFAKILLQSIYFSSWENRIINSSLKNLKTFKDFLRFFTQFKDFSKTFQRPGALSQ
jgi:hypothetical protein